MARSTSLPSLPSALLITILASNDIDLDAVFRSTTNQKTGMFDPFPQRVHAFNLGACAFAFSILHLDQTPVALDTLSNCPSSIIFLLILSFYSFPAIAIQDTTAGFRPKSLFGVDGCLFGRVFECISHRIWRIGAMG